METTHVKMTDVPKNALSIAGDGCNTSIITLQNLLANIHEKAYPQVIMAIVKSCRSYLDGVFIFPGAQQVIECFFS